MCTPQYEKDQESMPTHFSPEQQTTQPGSAVFLTMKKLQQAACVSSQNEGLGDFKDVANKALKSFHK